MADSPAAQRILERGIKRYMVNCVVTLRRYGVQEHEINAYGLTYMVAITDQVAKISKTELPHPYPVTRIRAK
ncbi:hypothetical protein OCOJLMKI_5130 [Methylobacterium iners]|uniref:Uncharacterized protein n=1 Tax=Methylobacterium iners TaxID=418707 RepID=A0ABQ4S4P2_9HYPH|nr:hypothetical protein OCOJLMKI_5130 [Methylobacterium iners]